MSDEPKCPKCGALRYCGVGFHEWLCGSYRRDIGTFSQSDRCRISELTQQVASLMQAEPNPARDYVRECNEQLAAKDRRIAELEAEVVAERDRFAFECETAESLREEIKDLERELAAAKATCRRWERLCETGFEFVIRPEGYIRRLVNGKWEASLLDGFRRVVDRPTDALAAIEAWEAEQKGAGT